MPIAARIILVAGSEYEMTEPNGAHYVRPLNGPSTSLMISGKPWGGNSPKSNKPLSALPLHKQKELFDFFQSIYK